MQEHITVKQNNIIKINLVRIPSTCEDEWFQELISLIKLFGR